MVSKFFILALLTFTQGISAATTTSKSTARTTVTPTSTKPTSTLPTTTVLSSSTGTASSGGGGGSVTSSSSAFDPSAPPDVLLSVPQLSVGRIELDVDNLSADINLAAQVASLVTINAGVQVAVQKINVTITDVEVELELQVRLGHLVDIVNRVFSSLDLNPLLINVLNNVTSLVDSVVGAVDGLLGSITQGGSTLNFLVDNLGNIVQEVVGVAGATTSTIVGNYLTNMTDTGVVQQLGNGFVQKTFNYTPLNALVNIIFNAAGQVVQAVVDKSGSGSSPTGSSTGTALPTSTVVLSSSATSSSASVTVTAK